MKKPTVKMTKIAEITNWEKYKFRDVLALRVSAFLQYKKTGKKVDIYFFYENGKIRCLPEFSYSKWVQTNEQFYQEMIAAQYPELFDLDYLAGLYMEHFPAKGLANMFSAR